MAKFYRFENKSYDAKRDAQVNLTGRTHYVDPDTLKYHNSKILKCVISDNGLLLSIIESYASYDGKRLFRPVIFDVMGNTIDRVSGSDGFKTKKQAEAALWESLEKINAVEHTKQALQRELDWVQNSVDRMMGELENV